MIDFLSSFWKILKLDSQVYEKTRDDKAGILFALKLFLVISVILSLGPFVTTLTSEPQGVLSRLENMTSRLDQLSVRLPAVLTDGITSLQQKVESISSTLEQYQPPLGRNLSYSLRAFGAGLSLPLILLGGWLAAALAVFLVAKILKGKGEIREHISVFLLGFAPQILAVVASFAFLGPILGITGNLLKFVAIIWSLVIVILALKIAHGFSTGRAIGVLLLSLLFFGVFFLF
jgi:flagellar biosynthesis protein FliQ